MKRDRDLEDESPMIGPNRTFRISPESTSSKTRNVNIHNSTLPININNDNATNATSDSNLSNNNSNNKDQDRFLPIANVGRIMKKVIPGNAKISKDAKETVQECVSEFISFVTGEASDKCQREKRKTINGDDILWAIMTLGFEDYVNPLKLYLTKYRDIEGEKLNAPKQQRMEQQLQHDPNSDLPYDSIYSSTSLISHPHFASNDQPFSLPFSQSSIQTNTGTPQDHIDDQW